VLLCIAGELMGVEYLYSQTGKVLHMAMPEPDDAEEEDQLLEEMPLDEGFMDDPVDVDYLTVSSGDDLVSPAAVSTSQVSSVPVAELTVVPSSRSVESSPQVSGRQCFQS